MPTRTAADVTAALGSLVLSTTGILTRAIEVPCPVTAARPRGITFVRRMTAALRETLLSLSEVTVIAPKDCNPKDFGADVTLICVAQPRLAFATALNRLFSLSPWKSGIHHSAQVDPSATISDSATIGPGCVIGPECEVGPDSALVANVVLYARVCIGARVVIHAGTVIGADGFGYERDDDGEFVKFPHLGGVIIEDDVEIGSNTSIDRASLGNTIIRRGAKIDNQVHVSHNVEIGEATAVIAQSMLGGSVKIGARSWIAPSACIMNQRSIGVGATVGLQALVVKDVADGTTVMGAPAAEQDAFNAERRAIKALIGGKSASS